jgi:hypothetical protein
MQFERVTGSRRIKARKEISGMASRAASAAASLQLLTHWR